MGDGSQILVVDHEPEWRTFTKSVLDSKGYNVRESGDVRTAIEAVTGNGFDLIIVDVLSEKLLKTLAEGYKRYRLLVFTTAPSVPEAVQAYRYGALDYVGKSFDASNLIDTVTSALERAPAQQVMLV